MFSITIDEICENLKYDTQKNFIGIAITVWQANGIDAFIESSRNKGIALNGFILLPSHHQTGRKLTEHSFSKLDHSIVVCKYKYKKVSPVVDRIFAFCSATNNTNSRTVYIAWTSISYEWINYIERHVPNCKVCFVLIDDGGGSYENRFCYELLFEKYNNPKQNFLKTKIKVGLRVLYYKILLHKLYQSNRIIDNRLFSKTESGFRDCFVRNQEVSSYYEKIYEDIAKKIPRDKIDVFESAIIINTQCLKENNITDGKVDFEIYENLVQKLTVLGLIPVVKPHPRELVVDKYNRMECIPFLDTTYSQESLIAGTRKKPVCIISIFSSTLLNAKGIFGIPAISLAKIIRDKKKINKTFKKQLDDYIDQYEGVFEFPSTIDETVKIICNNINNSNRKDVIDVN